MSEANSNDKVSKLEKIREYLKEYNVTSLYKYLQSAAGGYYKAVKIKDRGLVKRDSTGCWRWNDKKKITPQLAKKIFDEGNEMERQVRAKNKKEKDKKDSAVKKPKRKYTRRKVSVKIEEDPSNKILSLINNLNERIDIIGQEVELMSKTNKEASTRSRLDISDMRQDLSVMRRELPKIIQRSVPSNAS